MNQFDNEIDAEIARLIAEGDIVGAQRIIVAELQWREYVKNSPRHQLGAAVEQLKADVMKAVEELTIMKWAIRLCDRLSQWLEGAK